MNLHLLWQNIAQPSLARRLVFAQMGLLIVLWGLLVADFVRDIAYMNDWYEPQLLKQRADMILSVAGALADRPDKLQATLQQIDEFQRRENREEDQQGVRMTMNVWSGDQLLYVSPGEPGVIPTKLFNVLEIGEHNGQRTRTYTQQAVASPLRVVLILPSDAKSVMFTLWARGIVLLPIMVSMPLLIIPAWLSVMIALRPFRKLAADVENKGPHDLEPLAFQTRHRELRPLVKSINELLTRLRDGAAREKRFIADAAHELRTPLAAMRINVEALRERSREPKDAGLLDGLVHSGDRATRLVSQLLSLMRSDAGPQNVQSQELKLDEITQERLALLSGIARMREIELELDVPKTPVCIEGEREGIVSLIDNLVENAIKYSPPRGTVIVRVVGNEKGAEFIVTDSGPGIPSEYRERVFERFFRMPDQVQGGSGLGLAIVRSVSERHGALVSFEEPERGLGLRVRVQFANALALREAKSLTQ
jgi:two-component system sensor histidine kinase QseC